MTDIKPENRAFFWATNFLRALYESGVAHVIISPGSRSTPLTMAAAALPSIKKHVILDERSAAFFALGIGKVTNQPAALISTSGTAVANYYPAVVEARMSGVPMILLTADRPPDLRKAGANQSINQQKIYGDYAVMFKDAGEPSVQQPDLQYLQELARQSVSNAQNKKGPVHLNFPFRKPLEPTRKFVQKISRANERLNQKADLSLEKEITHFKIPEHLITAIQSATYPLVISGQLSAASARDSADDLAEALGAPLLSEQGISNNKTAINGFDGFLRQNKITDKLEPDLILRFGIQPASKSLLNAINQWKPNKHIHFADTGRISNIADTTTNAVNWNGHSIDTSPFSAVSDDWMKQWKKTEKNYFEKSDEIFNKCPVLTDGHVYRHLAPVIPKNWAIFVSNSFPARDQSLFGRWNPRPVFTNRGASGIDGITSTAMGVAEGSEKPVILFTGDLAFLHDTNAFLSAKKLNQPLVAVVINNSGGSIFRMLPIAEHTQHFNTYFETPQDVNIAKLASAYDLKYLRINQPNKLPTINLSDFKKPGLHVIECKTDPDASMQLRRKLWNSS